MTLSDRIEFDKTYSAEITAMRDEVFKKDDNDNEIPEDKDEVENLNLAIAIRNFAFFSNIPLEEVENNIPITQVASIFYACFEQIYSEQENIKVEESYLWKDKLWYIENPELSSESEITFNQLITSKQIVKQMQELGAGNWEAIKSLAVVYLRKENEKFDEKWLFPESDRMKMMDDLPMNIALHIGFFLQSSMSLFLKTLPYFQVAELEKDQV